MRGMYCYCARYRTFSKTDRVSSTTAEVPLSSIDEDRTPASVQRAHTERFQLAFSPEGFGHCCNNKTGGLCRAPYGIVGMA